MFVNSFPAIAGSKWAHITVPATGAERRDNRRLSGKASSPRDDQANQRRSPSFLGAARFNSQSALLHPCAAALNQNNQDDDKQNTSNNLDNRDTGH
jgi:hypothetical protein